MKLILSPKSIPQTVPCIAAACAMIGVTPGSRLLIKRTILTTSIAALLSLGGTARAADHYWNAGGDADTDFSTSANWGDNTVPVAGDNAFINVSGTATITADVAASGSRLNVLEVGRWFGSGTLTQTAGTVYTAGFNVGFIGTGVYNLNGSGSIDMTNDFLLGKAGGAADSGNGTLNMNTSGTFTTNRFRIADDSWGSTVGPSGTFNLSAGTVTSTYGFVVGGAATANTGLATLNLSGGVINSNGNFVIGDGNGAIGAFVMTGGVLNVTGPNGTEFWVGNGHNSDYSQVGHGTATISSGVLNVGSWFGVGRDGSQGTLTISGDAVVNQGITDSGSRLELGNFGNNNNSTLNLNGGTLAVNGIIDSGGAGDTTTFNWNGGTLKAREDNNFFLIADTINVQNGGAVIDSNGHNIRIDNVLAASGTGGLTKNGAGQLEIANQNTFTGAVVVNSGTLYANSGGGPNNRAFSYSSGITVNSGATLRAVSNSLFGWDGSQAKAITINGGTAVAENGDQNIGLVTLNGGTLASLNPDSNWGSWNFGRAAVNKLAVTDDSIVSAVGVGFHNGATIDVAAGKTLNFTGTIVNGGDGPSSVLKYGGSGTLILAGSNSYTGNTIVASGSLQIANANALGTSALYVYSMGTVDLHGNSLNIPWLYLLAGGKVTNSVSGTATLTASIASSTWTYGGSLADGAGVLALTKEGAGTLTLSSSSSYSGGTSVNSGVVEILDSNALGTGAVSIAAGGRVLVNANNLTLANNFILNGMTSGGALASGDLPWSNVTELSGTVTLNADSNIANWWTDKTLKLSGKITGAGGLTFDQFLPSNAGRFLVTGTTNDYQGATIVNGAPGFKAQLFIGANDTLPTGTAVTLNNADLYLNGFNQTLASISGSGNFTVQNGSATNSRLTLGAGNASSTFGGSIKDGGVSVYGWTTGAATVALTKTGTGALALTGSSNYSGGTQLNDGTLQVGNANALGTGALTVNGGTLDLAGNSISVPGLSGSGGTVANSVSGTATLTASIASSTLTFSSSLADGAGSVALTKAGAGTLTLSSSNSYSGGTSVNSGVLTILNSNALGTGDVSIAAGGQVLVNANNLTVANNFVLNGMTTGGAIAGRDLSWGNVTELSGTVTLNADSNIADWWSDRTIKLSGKITGTGGLTFDRITSGGGRFLVTGTANDYQGATIVIGKPTADGMLFIGANNALPTGTAVTLNDADLYLNGFNQTLASITGSGAFTVQNGSSINSRLTLGASDASSTFGGSIKDGGVSVYGWTTGAATVALTKTGTGALALTGSSNYSGGTTVSNGTLQIANASALGTGSLSVNGGTLDLNANSVTVSALSGSGGTITNTALATTGTLTANVSGSCNYAGAVVDGAGSVSLDKEGAGTLTLTGSISTAEVIANGGSLQLAQSGSIGSITIGSAGKLELSANNVNSAKVLDTSALSIATGGTLDLWDNALILRDQTAGINQGTNLSTIQGLVNTAFDNGNWDKPGITSSTVIADLSAYSVLTVMVYDNTVLGVDSFEGINNLMTDNGGNQVMLKTTYLGDFDGNGIVNSADYGWLDFYYGYGLTVGDLNGDGQVNSADYNGIDYGYGYQAYGILNGGGSTPAANTASVAAPASPEAVPEPGTLGMLLAGALGLLGFRRKATGASRS